MVSEQLEDEEKCPHCDDTGVVRDKDGSIHVCYKCLQNGKLDVHSKSVKDSGVRV